METDRRPPWWFELPFAVGCFLAITAISRSTPLGPKPARGIANARRVLALERLAGVNVEEAANRLLAARPLLATVANYVYAVDYVLSSVALLVFLYVAHPRRYRWGRRSCLVLNLLAALVFAFFPVAPPRLNPQLSIQDTVSGAHIWGTWGSPVAEDFNQFGALPSLHFALVVWVLVMLLISTRSVTLKLLGALTVVLNGLVIVTTGNHYVIDLVAGVVLVAISVAVTSPRIHQPRVPGQLGQWLRAHAILVR